MTLTFAQVRALARAEGYRIDRTAQGHLFAFDPRDPHFSCRAVDGVVGWLKVGHNRYQPYGGAE